MVRKPRAAAESKIYHVMSRGMGKQIIFEDDGDRKQYLNYLYKYVSENQEFELLAWCLMANHVHLLVRASCEALSLTMRALNTAYACYFNGRYERVGSLFQGRFKSEPVETDEYLKTVIRYIHQNPVKAGLCVTCDYRWSSYPSYVREDAPLRDVKPWVLGLFGGVEEFVAFHNEIDWRELKPPVASGAPGATGEVKAARRMGRPHKGEPDAKSANRAITPLVVSEVRSLERAERNGALLRLLRCGFSLRDIERLTGVPKSIVAQVSRDDRLGFREYR